MFTHGGRHTLLRKKYAMEDLADAARDINESFNSDFNPKANVIDADLKEGSIIITVTYKTSDCCDCQGFHHKMDCPHHVMVD